MSTVKILGARLSSNPDTATVKHNQGVNGLVNSTESGKLFYVVDALAPKGLTFKRCSEVVWADENDRFSVSAEDYDLLNKGERLEGGLQTFYDIPEYSIGENKFTHVELLVMKGQEAPSVIASFIKRQQQQNGASEEPIKKALQPKMKTKAPVTTGP